jgi:hypothetical protein
VTRLGKYCFDECRSLSTVRFERGSKLWRIGRCAFPLRSSLICTSPSVQCLLDEYHRDSGVPRLMPCRSLLYAVILYLIGLLCIFVVGIDNEP